MAVGWARIWRGSSRAGQVSVMALALTLAATLAGCSLGAGGDTGASNQRTLSSLPWCAQSRISFVDSSSSTQQTITSWDKVKDQLGFTPYLPPSLPDGSCLDLVGGTIHDPIFGGHLSITWVLPGAAGPISFSEAPRRGITATTAQCEQSGQSSDATTVCIGAVGDTSVTVASHLTESQITAYFKQLKPSSDWEPAPVS